MGGPRTTSRPVDVELGSTVEGAERATSQRTSTENGRTLITRGLKLILDCRGASRATNKKNGHPNDLISRSHLVEEGRP